MRSNTAKRLALTAAALASVAAPMLSSSAHADPKQLTAFVGVGSDTVQDVMNAMAGSSNNISYIPVTSSAATGARQLISFDAISPVNVNDTCITVKTGAPTFDRPNGSTNGRAALSRAIDGGLWGTANCGGITDVSGLIDFARSSSGTNNASGVDLTYIPFGRDAVSFATYRAGGLGGPVTALSRAQLTTLFTTAGGITVSNGTQNVPIIACGIQLGSGTYKFWNTVTTASAAQEATAVAACDALGPQGTTSGRLEENTASSLKVKGDLVAAGTQVVVGFSAASFIAKSNGKAAGDPAVSNVGIGGITDGALGSPVTGTAPNLAASATFYASTIYGRNVYNVLPRAFVISGGNQDLKTMFVGSGSAVCSATSTILAFGFLTLGTGCGTTTETGPLIAGNFNV